MYHRGITRDNQTNTKTNQAFIKKKKKKKKGILNYQKNPKMYNKKLYKVQKKADKWIYLKSPLLK